MAKNNKAKAKSNGNKGKAQTVKALQLVAETKQNHSMRKRLESEGVDAFALHAFTHISEAYIAICLALVAIGKAIIGESVTLFCNGVTERITLDRATGNYSRQTGHGKLIFGNFTALKTVYGDAVQVMTDAQVKAAFAAQKEQVTRKLGTGLNITGRIISQGKKGEMILDVVAVDLGNGKFALHNLESLTNAHQRKVNRWQGVQTTTAKEKSAQTAAQKANAARKAEKAVKKTESKAETVKTETAGAGAQVATA